MGCGRNGRRQTATDLPIRSIVQRPARRAGLFVNERVDIYDIDNGKRFSTYVIEASVGSGTVGLNGAAARLAMVGNKVMIIVVYAGFDAAEAAGFRPRVVLVDENNRVMSAG